MIRKAKYGIEEIGAYVIMLFQILKKMKFIFDDKHLILSQMYLIGVNSLPLVSLISIFTGAIAVWQVAYHVNDVAPSEFVGGIATRIIVLELAPVMTGIIVAGRVGASVAAELSSMKITEQLDALTVMGLHPYRYLAMPRLVATMFMMPVIVIFAIFVAILGAFIASIGAFDITSTEFVKASRSFFFINDLFGGLTKSIAFGLLTATTGCYAGFNASLGSQGVGSATVKSFVISSSLILITDFVFWFLLF